MLPSMGALALAAALPFFGQPVHNGTSQGHDGGGPVVG